ncbi:alpha/beta hydrolase family protein [Streptomyces sp. NPDC047014]|uniref:alpha/beta fold hydrolase n=1 Tax=Streptomyces sp. NPDC047014 TaxID=3155736 RepID=UPI0033E44312
MSRTAAPTAFRSAYEDALARWPERVEPFDVPTPFGRTRVNRCGPPGAPPLVLLPGGGASSAVWGECVGAGLARTHRLCAVDLVGEPGLSSPVPGRPLRTVADLGGWLDAVLDVLAPDGPVVLGGHSYGAWIAAHYAARRPERVGRLLLLDPTQVFAGLRPRYVLRALPMLLRPTPGRIRSFLAWESGGDATALDPEWLRLQECAAAFPTVRPVTGPRPRLAGRAGPRVDVLLAARARCHDAARVARAARDALPGARVEVVPGVSHHAFPLTAAPRVAALLAAD